LGDEITDVAIDWINRNGKKDDWFLHINIWDPHQPYRAPQELGEPFIALMDFGFTPLRRMG
jgi:hypothetical protein